MFIKYQNIIVLTRLLGLALLGTVIVGCDSSHQTLSELPQPKTAERLKAVLDQAVANGLPGVSLAIRGDSINFTGVAGVGEIATAVPLSVDHRFYLASVGKTYTAVTLVRLAADGLLNLDDPITTWLPVTITDRIPSSDAITVRSLLNHTSGIFDFSDDGEDFNDARDVDISRHWTNADMLPFFLDKPLHFEPTTDYRYSNSNYVLAALIGEAASGLSIQELIRNYIVAPLGLQQTVHGNEALGLSGFAHGYFNDDGDLIDVYPLWSQYGVSDGGIQSSAADLADFVHGVLTDDIVLNDAMRAEFLTPSGIGNPSSTYALGIVIDAVPNPEISQYWHNGKNAGSQADFIHVTSADESLTITWCASAAYGDYDVWYEQFKQAVLEVLIDAEVVPGSRS